MGNKSSSEISLCFLLVAALCMEAVYIYGTVPDVKMNWTQARLYCQENHIDLVTWKVVGTRKLAQLLAGEVGQLWIGLHRDPEKDSVWKGINLKSGEGLSGKYSRSKWWADGERSSHCAAVGEDLKWHSEKCSREHHFSCSQTNTIQHHENTLNWSSACQYCQSNAGVLATITDEDEVLRAGWIGLYREAGESWRWIGNRTSDYRNWAEGEPLNADCGSFNLDNRRYYSKACSEELQFACFEDNLVVVNENKTWEEAMEHCRSMDTCERSSGPCRYRYDLLSPNLLLFDSYVGDRIYRATTEEV